VTDLTLVRVHYAGTRCREFLCNAICSHDVLTVRSRMNLGIPPKNPVRVALGEPSGGRIDRLEVICMRIKTLFANVLPRSAFFC
jgi:hypothetical protein